MTDHLGQLGDSVIEARRNLITVMRGHDEPMPGAWLCGHCPYMNVGPVCTKCGAPRYDGTEVRHG